MRRRLNRSEFHPNCVFSTWVFHLSSFFNHLVCGPPDICCNEMSHVPFFVGDYVYMRESPVTVGPIRNFFHLVGSLITSHFTVVPFLLTPLGCRIRTLDVFCQFKFPLSFKYVSKKYYSQYSKWLRMFSAIWSCFFCYHRSCRTAGFLKPAFTSEEVYTKVFKLQDKVLLSLCFHIFNALV